MKRNRVPRKTHPERDDVRMDDDDDSSVVIMIRLSVWLFEFPEDSYEEVTKATYRAQTSELSPSDHFLRLTWSVILSELFFTVRGVAMESKSCPVQSAAPCCCSLLLADRVRDMTECEYIRKGEAFGGEFRELQGWTAYLAHWPITFQLSGPQ